MSMCITYRAAAALGVWAALHTAPGALAETPSPAYWAGPRLERPTVRTALAVAPQQISVPGSEAGVFVHQIDPRAAGTRQPLRSRFASWYLRRHCRNGGEFSEYCKRMQSPYETAGTGDAPRPAPAGLADLTLDAGVALIPAASPAPYIPRRHDWLHPELEPSPAAICRSCAPATAFASNLPASCNPPAGAASTTRRSTNGARMLRSRCSRPAAPGSTRRSQANGALATTRWLRRRCLRRATRLP